MGGKGQRRREKNYRAAHGGPNRLPPPPDSSKPDRLPAKLRQILAFSSPHQESANASKDSEGKNKKRKREDGIVIGQKKPVAESKAASEASTVINENDNEIEQDNEKRKKKKSRKQVDDLRFEKLTKELGTSSKRKERKKKYLEAKKNKRKPKTGEELEFPGHEKIKFGDVVKAPPKIVKVPKAFNKTVPNASQERIRLKTIEDYRNRKGWTARPGLQLPTIISTTPTL